MSPPYSPVQGVVAYERICRPTGDSPPGNKPKQIPDLKISHNYLKLGFYLKKQIRYGSKI